MTNNRFQLLLVVFFALLAVTRPAGALLSCYDVFSVRPQSISELINNELVKNGIAPQAKPNVFARFREWREFRKLDPYQLTNTALRENVAQKILDSHLNQSLDVLDEKELSKTQRAALNRIVLRSLIERGLLNRAEFGVRARNVQSVRLAFARLFQHPAFRALTLLELPTKKVFLSEPAVWELLNGGLDSSELRSLIKIEANSANIRSLNAVASRLMTVGYIAASVWLMYPSYSAQYDLIQAKKSQQFKQAVVSSASIDAGSIALTMANGEKRAVLASFEARYHDKPTAAEANQIKTEVCTGRYGSMLSVSEHASCLSN